MAGGGWPIVVIVGGGWLSELVAAIDGWPLEVVVAEGSSHRRWSAEVTGGVGHQTAYCG